MSFFVASTIGALLLGGFCAAVLSGVTLVQTFLYVRLFPDDSTGVKSIVAAVWVLDTVHSILVYTSIWMYAITHFGDVANIGSISIPLALTVITTAFLTLIVHCFFVHRIYKLSRWRWHFVAFILILAFFRLCCASVTTAEMIHMKTFKAFKAKFRWVFTLGLAMSCLVDILITGSLTLLLRSIQREKKASTSLDRVISAVVLYTFETNLLTSTATTVSMVCWLAMPNNLVFMGLHFFIAKLYANSLLVTLNTRKELQHQRQRSVTANLPVGFPRFQGIPRAAVGLFSRNEHHTHTKLEITVEKTVEFGSDKPAPTEGQKRTCIIE